MKKLFYDSIYNIDKLKSKDTLSDEQIKWLLNKINDLKYFRYFFYNLDNHLFVAKLPFRQYISNALSDENTNRSFYVGEYLKRIAKKDSKNVSRIILASKPKDSRINSTLLQVILLLDIKDAIKLAHYSIDHLICKGLFEGKIISDLVIKFINEKKTTQALLIFDFVTRPISRSIAQPPLKELQSPNREEAEGRLEEYEFKELMQEAFPKLLEIYPRKVIHILERNLKVALDIESKSTKTKRREDYSYIWRPAIEEHEQNYNFGRIKELLVSKLRDSLKYDSTKGDKHYLHSLLQRYMKSRYTIFKRLALYIYCEDIEAYANHIQEILLNKKLLEDHRIRHEIYRLLKQSYPKMKVDVQRFILNWIDAGPDTKWWIDWRIKEEIVRPSEERISEFSDHWRLEKYWIIREHLASLYPERVKIIDQLEKKLGTPEHPDFPSWHESTTYGYESPLSVVEFLRKNDAELIEILNNPPPVKELDPIFKHQGLGMVFAEAIKQEPERFLRFASSLSSNKVLPVFIGHYFQGLREAWGVAKDNWKPNWSAELDVLSSLVANTGSITSDWTADERSGVRLHLCRFIELLVSDRSRVLDDTALSGIKNILLAMLGDPDPDADSEIKNYATNRDWPFISLNHTSGQVLHTLMRYCLCYARIHPNVGNRFEQDVKTKLENVFENETRPSVFSVFGTYLANLWYLDAEWTKNNLSKIFPENNRILFNAVWDSYLKFNNVYKDVFDSIKQYYLRSITTGIKEGQISEFDLTRLAQHLSLVYWNGWEDVTDNASTVTAFFLKAPLKLRVDFVRQIWVGLEEMKKTGQLIREPQAWVKAKELWFFRAEKAISVEGHNRQEDEISAYLDWLSACPENVDTMENLISISLRKWKAQYHSGAVTEYLALQSTNYPSICVKLLNVFFSRPWDKSYYYFDEKEVRQIMENALSKGGDSAKIAAEIASKLGEYGRFDFKDIWDKVNVPKV